MKKLTTLSNGIRIATETTAETRQVALLCSMSVGGLNDPKNYGGLAHFVEHSLFLGTKTRTQAEILFEEQQLGDLINAETSPNAITLEATVIPEDLPAVMDLFADLIQNPKFPTQLVERERNIITTEVAEVIDINRLTFMTSAAAYGDSPMGRPVGGIPETISQIPPSALKFFHKKFFRPENLIISAAGQFDEQALIQQCETLFSQFKNNLMQPELEPSSYQGGQIWKQTPDDNDSFILAFDGIPVDERKERLTGILFGYMLERVLEEELRIKRGLLYSLTASHSDIGGGYGSFYISSSCEPANMTQIVKSICDIVKNFDKHFTQEDLYIAQKKQKLVLSHFNPMEQADINLHYVGYFNELYDNNEAYRRIDEITLPDIIAIGRRIFSSKPTFSCLGHEENKTVGLEVEKWVCPKDRKVTVSAGKIPQTQIALRLDEKINSER